jgi:fermentation-respiration switch protein FrsA (DUF1100 family)
MKTEKDPSFLERKLRALWASLPEEERKKPENVEPQLTAKIQKMMSPWIRTFLALDPRGYLKKVSVPVLAINGERDVQVPPKENLGEIAKALKHNHDVTIRELPQLNHLFQHCKTGAPSEYAQIDETFSPEALDLVGDWILKHAK